jgi:hypothetical protein
LENDPATTLPEDEDRNGGIMEPATNNNLGAQGNEGRDVMIVPLSNIFNGDLEAQEVKVKRRVDFTLQITTMDEVDWMYGAASCPPWGSCGSGVMLWMSGRVFLVIGMGRWIAIYDRSEGLYLWCKVWKVKLEVAISGEYLRVRGKFEETAPGRRLL